MYLSNPPTLRDLFRKHDEAWDYYAAEAVRSGEQLRLAGCHWALQSIDGAGSRGQTTSRGRRQPQAAAEGIHRVEEPRLCRLCSEVIRGCGLCVASVASPLSYRRREVASAREKARNRKRAMVATRWFKPRPGGDDEMRQWNIWRH